MAASIITLDRIDEGTVTQDRSGYHATRKAVVKSLDNAIGQLRTIDALAVAGIPQLGDRLDGVPSPFVSVVSSRSTTALSTTAMEVLIQYDPPDDIVSDDPEPSETGPSRLSVRTSLEQVTSNKDADGLQITLEHNALRYKETQLDGDGNAIAFREQGDLIRQVGEIQETIPTTVITYERMEPRDPRAKAQRYVGHVDPSHLFGDPPRSWMCTRLDGVPSGPRQVDGNFNYLATYEFQRSVEPKGLPPDLLPTSGWDPIVATFDHDNNTFFNDQTVDPPEDGANPSIRQIVKKPEADFRALRLFI